MTTDAFFTMSEWETIVFQDLNLSLKSLENKIIPADPIDESIPEWEGLIICFEMNIDNKKKTTQFSILSTPYESIMEQSWKNYRIVIKKIKDSTVKIKIIYNEV